MMRVPKVTLLGGVAALALAGAAHASPSDSHTMTIRLPNGQAETIRYTGEIPPTVVIAPDGSFTAMPMAFTSIADPFAMMQRVAADMDRQAAIMLQQVEQMAAQPMFDTTEPMTIAGGPGVCMESVQITYTGHGQPHVVRQTSGDCGPATHATTPSTVPEPPAATHAPGTIEVRNPPVSPYQSLIHRVSTLAR
ncbi:MAG TPA: hypothetical protein VE690_00955 [Rhodopila sp.]|nr:hypothetical protein [Rhodopila sp.]